jgi:hypothetical protein
MSAQLSYHANRAVCRFATAGEASSLWLLRLLWFAPLPRTKEGSSSSPAAYAAARSQWHSRRGHQAPAPAGCRTLSEYGEQLIIRRSKHKLKDFPLYIPHLSGSRTCGGRRATAARLLRGSCTSAAGSEGRTRSTVRPASLFDTRAERAQKRPTVAYISSRLETRKTSSSVVMPLSTFRMPSS